MYDRISRSMAAAATMAIVVCSQTAAAQELFFGYQSPGLNANTVAAFPRTATGTIAATRSINGASTGLNSPDGISIDSVNGEIAVANGAGNSITVYAISASGNATPLRTITGPSTGLSRPLGVAIDAVNNEIIVMNNQTSVITVYPRTANGDVAPLRTVSGTNTVFWVCCNPYSLALDTVNNEILVPLSVGRADLAGYTVFSRTANGNVAPLRTVRGNLTTFGNAQGIAVDTVNNEIAVTDAASGSWRALTFLRSDSGNVAPQRILTIPDAMGVRIDPANNELLAASGSGVNVYARTASGAASPLRTLRNSAGGSGWDVALSTAAGPAPTTTGVISSLNPSTAGQAVTFTATVTGSSPTGTIQFMDGATNLGGAVTMSGGQATYPTSALAVGSHNITAVYSGDTNNAASTSPVLVQVVSQAPTTTGVVSTLNPSTFGQSVTFTATVTGTSPTGTIQFMDGATNLGAAVTMSGGQANYPTSALAVGSHNITAVYSGDTNNVASTSPVLTQVVLAEGPASAIPTLSGWGLLALALGLAILGARTLGGYPAA